MTTKRARPTTRKIFTAKRLAAGAAAVWLLGAGWLQFFPAEKKVYSSFRTEELSPAEACRKKFSRDEYDKRYDCISAAAFGKDLAALVSGARKTFIVFGPPLLLLIGVHVADRRRERKEAAAKARHRSGVRVRLSWSREDRIRAMLEERKRRLAARKQQRAADLKTRPRS